MANQLVEVQKFGQSIWFDNIRRGLITSGELQEMVDQDGLKGVTSNPAIFEKAIAGSTDYDPATKALVSQGVGTAKDIFEHLAIGDIQLAADVLHPVYLRTDGKDGFVSMEVSPYLAHDTAGTVKEARRLHAAIGRDNVMIKVPATPEGIPAIRELIGDGIHVNVTLLFSVDVYETVARAYAKGLEKFLSNGGDAARVASVASFFVSRIDSLIDQKLCDALDQTRDPDRRAKLKSLVGKVAIANAKMAYTRSVDLSAEEGWRALASKGARPQRLLWASTSTKNPKYPTTLYVDELIGPDTVNTVPAETFGAFRTEGKPGPTLTDNMEQAAKTMPSTSCWRRSRRSDRAFWEVGWPSRSTRWGAWRTASNRLSITGGWREKSVGCGTPTPVSGAAAMKIVGWGGSISWTGSATTWNTFSISSTTRDRRNSVTSSCWAWGARVCAPRCCVERLESWMGSRSSWSWTRPYPPR
jgi:transaldolase/glucose-6-phosphate isomerase